MIVKNLITSLLLSGTIATGGIQSDTDTTSFNNVPKTATFTANWIDNFTLQMSYNDKYQNNNDTLCEKYYAENTTNTSYALITSYSYSFTTWQPKKQTNAPMVKYRNITFYKVVMYRNTNRSEIDLKYTLRPNIVNGNLTTTANINAYKYNNYEDIDEYLNITNLITLYEYTPNNTTNVINQNDIQIYNNGPGTLDRTIDLGQFINTSTNTEIQSYVVITDSVYIGFENETVSVDANASFIQPQQNIINITGVNYDYEVIDIPSIMFTILTLPFSFISQALGGFTLFENTPYQINIGNIIIVVLSIFIFIWIINKVIKMKI